MTIIYVDGDACPVKEEIYRAAAKRGLKVLVAAASFMRVPPNVEVVVTGAGEGTADDWIAGHAGPGDIVVTADIPLASRALKAGAVVVDHRGKEFTDGNIGSALATRDLMKHIRQVTGKELGPKPFSDKDRRKFMREFSRLLELLVR